MNWQLRMRQLNPKMSLDIVFVFPYIHETGTRFGYHIGYVGFEWEYDIDLNTFMTTVDDDAVIFSKSGGWL